MSNRILIGIILLNGILLCAFVFRGSLGLPIPQSIPDDSAEPKVLISLPPRPTSAQPNASSDNAEVKALQIAAFDAAEKTLNILPNSPEALNLIGTLHLRSNSESSARRIWVQMTERIPESEDAWLNLAHLAIKESEYDEACRCFSKAEDIAPDVLEIYSPYADAAFQAGSYAQALRILERKAALTDLTTADLCVRGRAHSALGATDEAVKALELALNLSPDSREALNSLAQTYRLAGASERAKEIAARLAAVNARSPRVEASRDVEGRDLRLAEQLFTLAVTQCCNALVDQGKITDAFNLTEWGLQIAPGSSVIFLSQVNSLLRDGQNDLAMKQYVRFTISQPDDDEVWMHFAETALRLRRLDAARMAADRVLELRPDATRAMSINCQALLASGGDLDQAVALARRAYALESSAAGAYLLGTALFHADDITGARTHLTRATELAPKNTEYRRALSALPSQ